MIKTKLLSAIPLMLLLVVTTACSQPTSPQQIQNQQGPLVLTDEQGRYPLGRYIDILEDPSGELTIEQVASPDYNGEFIPSQVATPNFGYTDSVYWVRLPVRNLAHGAGDWLLELGFANMHYVDLYTPSPGGDDFIVRQTGSLRPFTTHDFFHHHIIFRLSLPPQELQTIYLRFQSGGTMTLPLTIWSIEAFTLAELPKTFVFGLFYGAIIIMLGYNLFIYFSLHESQYLYHVLFLVSIILLIMTYDGLASQYLWPRLMIVNRYAIPLFYGLVFITMLLFTRSFLLGEVRIPWMSRLHTIILVIWGLFILSVPFVKHGILVPLMNLWSLGTMIVIILTGVLAIRNGYRPARFFLLAWLGFFVPFSSSTLVRLNILPSMPSTEDVFRVGLIWLILFWSLSLADRINTVKTEMEATSRSLSQSESQLRTFLDAMPLGVSIYDANRKVQYSNQRANQILSNPARGIHPDNNPGRTLGQAIEYFSLRIGNTNVTYPEDRLPLTQALLGENAHVNDIEADLIDYRVPLEAWASPVFSEDGDVQYAISIFQDITLRKRFEESLQESQARLSGILDMAAEVIITTDENQRIRLFNKEAERIFGYSQEEAIDQPMDILIPERYRESSRQRIEAFRKSETTTILIDETQTIYFQRKGGVEFPANGSITKLDLKGKTIFTFMLQDITQRLLIEADLERHRTELEELVKTRTDELTRANERLKNEISIRLEHARLLAAAIERNRLARDLHDSVTQVLFSANLVAEVLPELWHRNPVEGQEALLELLRLTRAALAEMRTLLLELRPDTLPNISLGELIAQLTEAVTSRTNLSFELFIENIPPLPEDVHTNFYRIAQEALNNVVKHANASQVTVSLKTASIHEAGTKDGSYEVIRLIVGDNGVAFQTDSLGKERMGLGIMRERARAIGADLDISSKRGEGTQVTLVWKKNHASQHGGEQ